MSAAVPIAADDAPAWLQPLIGNLGKVPDVYRGRLSDKAFELIIAANAKASATGARRDAAVLVLFSGPDTASEALPDDADLLVTVRASTLRLHAGQAAFPGGASDPGDDGPVATALREAREETGLDVSRLRPLAILDQLFIAPSGFHVVPVVAYSPDPGQVAVVDTAETAIVARVPVRAFINPENRIMVYRNAFGMQIASPAFVLNEMLVWGFTGQIVSAMLDVAGWAQPWNTDDLHDVDEVIAQLGHGDSYGEPQQ